MKTQCEHDFIDDDNEGCYGKEICRFCGFKRKKDKENPQHDITIKNDVNFQYYIDDIGNTTGDKIVKTVNSHNALVEACKLAIGYITNQSVDGELALEALQQALSQVEDK